MIRGEIPIEPGDSWLSTKTMVVVLSIINNEPIGVQHQAPRTKRARISKINS